MRQIELIVLHCSASPFGDAALIRQWHLARGFGDIGYHFVILNGYPDGDSHRLHRPQFWRDGVVEPGREVEREGAHVQGHNHNSVGVCLVGDSQFTQMQFSALCELLAKLRKEFPAAKLMGHYELLGPGDAPKSCPNLDMEWVRGLVNQPRRSRN